MLRIEHLRKVFGDRNDDNSTVAISDLSFEVRERELFCIVGPSGCGKTTLLRCIAGLLPATSGRVELKGRPIIEPPAQMAFVFQEYGRSLFPWMTVEQNVRFPLRRKPMPQSERNRLVTEMLEAVRLIDFTRHYPWQLSGGMQQRVAIARALAYQPEVLLMDEPFGSVDAQTRFELEDLLLRIWQLFEVTIVFVTHDIDEAVYMSDRVLVLTPRPSNVRETIPVDLPRPRNQVATRELPAFAHFRAHVYRAITC